MSDKYITRLCILCCLPVNIYNRRVTHPQNEDINADLQTFFLDIVCPTGWPFPSYGSASCVCRSPCFWDLSQDLSIVQLFFLLQFVKR